MLFISFNKSRLKFVLLTPSSIHNFQGIIFRNSGFKAFPLMHIYCYKQITFVDINNKLGRGHNAIYDVSGHDRSMFQYRAASVEEFLAFVYRNLRGNKY